MKLGIRTASFALTASLVSLSACGDSDDGKKNDSSEEAGGADSGSGGSSSAGKAGSAGGKAGGAGGTSAGGARASGGNTPGTGGASSGGKGSGGANAGGDDGGTGGADDAGAGGSSDAGTGDAGTGGTPAGDGGSRLITAADGGTLTADGLVLVIPPGALATDTAITVGVGDGAGLPAESTLVAKVYDLGPDGTTFTKRVTLTIDVDGAKLGTRNPVVSYLEGGKWIALPDSVLANGKVTASTTHFTQFGVVSSDAAACQALPKAECSACCKATYANGAGEAEPLANAIKYCACTAGAPCDADCAANVCAGQAPSAACQACLGTQGSANPQPPCMTQGQEACALSPSCAAYAACQLGCP